MLTVHLKTELKYNFLINAINDILKHYFISSINIYIVNEGALAKILSVAVFKPSCT